MTTVHDQIAAELLELEEDVTWLPVAITRDGTHHQGSYATDGGTIVVIYRGRTVSTWVAPLVTNVPILARVLLDELVLAPAP